MSTVPQKQPPGTVNGSPALDSIFLLQYMGGLGGSKGTCWAGWLESCANKIRHLNESNPSANVEYRNGLRRSVQSVCGWHSGVGFSFISFEKLPCPFFKSLLMWGIWFRFFLILRCRCCCHWNLLHFSQWNESSIIWFDRPCQELPSKSEGTEHQIYLHTNRRIDCHNIFYIEHDFDCTIEV